MGRSLATRSIALSLSTLLFISLGLAQNPPALNPGLYAIFNTSEGVITARDPTATSAHNCGVTVDDEFLPGLRFSAPGRLALANNGNPDSGGCQFFITAQLMPLWDGKYTIFGEVVAGLDVVSKISRMPVHGDKPVDPVKLMHVSIERIDTANKTPAAN
jgi:cyclophilin family peptidyl-prolyl cis-trans isomerase